MPSAPYRFIATPGAGAGEALFSLAAAMTDEQSIDVALLYAPASRSTLTGQSCDLLGDIYVDTKQYQNAINAYEQTPPARRFASTPIRDRDKYAKAGTHQGCPAKLKIIARIPEL
jgi:hypothetical protein